MRRHLSTSILSVVAATLCQIALVASTQPPNIVLIISDDQNWRDFSFMGTSSIRDNSNNPVVVTTPNIDQLASSGVLFHMGHCPVGVCRPSLTSILTGLNPVQSGVLGNGAYVNNQSQSSNSVYNDSIRRNVELNATIPRVLADHGYLSLQTGKWWEGNFRRAGYTHGETNNNNRHISTSMSSIGRVAGNITSRIGAFVDTALAANKPFLVTYAPLLPHKPHNPPAIYLAPYAALVSANEITQFEADYLASVDWFDASIGELRTLMQNKGVDDDTLYVFVVDNGYLQTPNSNSPSYGAPRGKRSPFEDGVRTPIILYQNGQVFDTRTIAQKLQDTTLASSTDLMPTILEYVGAKVPETLQGINLLSSVQRGRMFGETYNNNQPVILNNAYVIGNPNVIRSGRFYIEDNWKLLLVDTQQAPSTWGTAVQLYDLATDPGEQSNLAAAQPARVSSMTAILDQWWTETRPTYLYDHEFDGSPSGSVAGQAPDVKDNSLPATTWAATSGIGNNGSINGGTTAHLPFTPQDDKRYELRASIEPAQLTTTGLALGFFDIGAPAGDPGDDGLAWLRITRDGSANLDVELLARADGGVTSTNVVFNLPTIAAADLYALTLVLKTDDNDASIVGDQWSVELLANGILRATHIFTQGNPAIENVGIGGFGSQSSLGNIDYLQLVEVAACDELLSYGSGCHGIDLSMDARPVLGTSPNFLVLGYPSPGTGIGFAVLSFTRHDPGLSLAGFGAPGCEQYVNNDVLRMFVVTSPVTTVPLLAGGIPNNLAFTGLPLFGQAVTLSAGFNSLGVITSNGVALVLCPF